MLAKTKAIVLRNTNYRDSSVISKMYTREFGIRSYILQSIRKNKKGIRPSMIQPLTIVDLDVYEKPNVNIQRIKELKVDPILINIQDSIIKKTIALYVVELLNNCLLGEYYEHSLFDYLEARILELDTLDEVTHFPIELTLGLTHFLGIEPSRNFSNQNCYFDNSEGSFVANSGLTTASKDASALLYLFQNNKHTEQAVNKHIRRELLENLILYYQTHLLKTKRLKSLDILSELLS